MAGNDAMAGPRDPEMTSRLFYPLSIYISVLYFVFFGKLSCKVLAL